MTSPVAQNTGKKTDIIIFVSGMTRRSLKTVRVVKAFFDSHLKTYNMKIFDVYQEDMEARQETLPVAPLLVGDFPKRLNVPLKTVLQSEDVYLPMINVRMIPVGEWKGLENGKKSAKAD